MNRPTIKRRLVTLINQITGEKVQAPAREESGNRHTITRQPVGYYEQKRPARFLNSSPARTEALRKERQ